MLTKRTFSLSEDNVIQLEALVPKSKRSRFVDNAVAKAIEQATKEQAVEALKNFKRFEIKGKGVVETIREIRQSEVDNVVK